MVLETVTVKGGADGLSSSWIGNAYSKCLFDSMRAVWITSPSIITRNLPLCRLSTRSTVRVAASTPITHRTRTLDDLILLPILSVESAGHNEHADHRAVLARSLRAS